MSTNGAHPTYQILKYSFLFSSYGCKIPFSKGNVMSVSLCSAFLLLVIPSFLDSQTVKYLLTESGSSWRKTGKIHLGEAAFSLSARGAQHLLSHRFCLEHLPHPSTAPGDGREYGVCLGWGWIVGDRVCFYLFIQLMGFGGLERWR